MPDMWSQPCGQSQIAAATETNWDVAVDSSAFIIVDRIRTSQLTHTTSEQYQIQLIQGSAAGTGSAGTPEPDITGGTANPTSADLIDDSVEPAGLVGSAYIDAAWNSLTGRDIVQPPGKEFFIGPGLFINLRNITPAGTTTMTPLHNVHFGELL